MKKLIILFAALFTSASLFSQSVSISESSESFSSGNHNALVATFKHSDKDKVEKEWKNLIKDFNPEHVNDKKHEYFFDNTKFTAISANTIDVYSIVFAKDGEVRLMATFDLGGAYASSSSHSKEMAYFKVIMKDFAIKMVKQDLEEKVKDATKLLEKTTDKRKDLEKDNKNLDQDIIDYKEKIKKAENKIEENKKEIETKKKEEGEQQKAVEELKKKIGEVK
ncbi:MAG: hypothetical protein ACOVLD_04765 [Bacteroidia bacterium]